MKILIPTLGFARQGGYRVLSELASGWIKMGHECTFLIPATSEDPYFPTNAKIIRCNRSGVVDARDEKSANGFDNISSLFGGLKEIGSKYDIILANHSLTAWPVRWANCGSASKFYYIQAYEPGYYPWLSHPIKRILSKLSYALNLNRISNSSTYADDGVCCVSVIPPGIDLSIFTKKPAEHDGFKGIPVVIGTIGRTEPYKGTATAIAAYRKVRSTYPNITMKIAFGNVAPAQDYDIIQIDGDKELAEYYRSLDLLIVSCYSQHGAPHYPLIEAMASGIPVVQTNYYPGDDANSWPAKSPSVEDVAAALEKLLAAPSAKVTQRTLSARKTVEEHLSWESVAGKFIAHFESCALSKKSNFII